MPIPVHRGLSAIVADYDAFVLDLWGTLHDGVALYPGAVDCLRRLSETGKPVVFLSNAPRRASAAQEKLDELGVDRAWYRDIVTSGEATYRFLADRNDPWIARLGKRLYHLGPDRDSSVYDGLDYTLSGTPAGADLVLNTGVRCFSHDEADYRDEMDAALAAGLPMLCANPDREIVRQGARVICAGALADVYVAHGGEVHWIGKPDPAVFALCLARLGIADPARALMIGDSLHTDIAGARAAGLPSALITGGIHGAALDADYGVLADPGRVTALCDDAGEAPAAALPGLLW